MLKDWDFAQFFPNWNATPANESPLVIGARSSEEPAEEKSTSSGSSSGGLTSSTPPRMHRRNESDSALTNANKGVPPNPDPLRMLWAGRHRSVREPTIANDESVSLTEFSRKASQLELRSKASSPCEFAPPRREKTDILDLRRLELKRELEERRRANGSGTERHSQSEVRGSGLLTATSSITRPSRPPLMKSTSEPCAPLTLYRDHQQVSWTCPRKTRNESSFWKHHFSHAGPVNIVLLNVGHTLTMAITTASRFEVTCALLSRYNFL